MKPIRDILDAYLQELDVPATSDTPSSLRSDETTAVRIRRHIHRDDLWRAGAVGEQLTLDLGGGTAVTA